MLIECGLSALPYMPYAIYVYMPYMLYSVFRMGGSALSPTEL